MSDKPTVEPIRKQVQVELPSEAAFQRFTEGLGEWWPPAYTWSGESLVEIAMEPGKGGRCYEPGPEGLQCDWGRVKVWEPPERVVFSWQISPSRVPVPDPEKASQVSVIFDELGPGRTKVTFEHRDFANHGEGAAGYRQAMAAPEGWPWILDQFASVG